MSLEFYFLNNWKRNVYTCQSIYVVHCSVFYSVTRFIFFHSRNVDHITVEAPNMYVKFIKNILRKNSVTYLQKEK